MKCQCEKCHCSEEFEPIDKENLLNTIQHGRLDKKQIEFAMKRLDNVLCEKCFLNKHQTN
ncbi:hypothetical protein SU86_002390 [Candidatus Nitrosotenuis cloacae]|uniref:Uncharacterized protein n=1 Tax=Candidatus Nitrosotenuis cloacae TaxID=1603555 RepID=A0A3G1B1G0_9ARCH|nr:hypothetical protein SU86_002390 [Candidatus Nitrosotenuis cloacae]